ncbi:MAG TPA: tetratricopeptide repeat protein, partial [Streptosporangiaceae bacterium]|nr:tetratricopeptide repeat protein [Streptosporangiaceae bacterium]
RVAPDDAAALVRLGALCRAAGDLAEALRLHARARDLQPSNPEALQHLAQDYEATGQTDAAIEVLERLRAVAPDNVWVLERLRDLLAQAGRWGDAAEAQAAILGGATGEGGRAGPALQAWCGLRARAGRAALEAGRAREAAAVAREVLRADSRFAPAYVLLGETHLHLGRPGRAVRLWHRAYEVTGHTALLACLERAYLAEERPHRLIDFFHRALLRAPDDVRLRYRLARLCLRLEMLDEAAAELEAVARDAPAFAPALHDLAEVHRRRGHLAQALDYARRALAASRAPDQAFRCGACGAAAEEWKDRCPACGRWNTLADPLPPSRAPGEAGGAPAPVKA